MIWIAFVAEYGYLLALADNGRRFVRAHWFDLLIIILTPPLIWLPYELDAIRALRALRVIRPFAVVGREPHAPSLSEMEQPALRGHRTPAKMPLS